MPPCCFKGKRWEFAYYAAGYAVECALKACVLSRMIHTGWVFEEKWEARKCLAHDFEELVRLAGLNEALATSNANNPTFANYWGIVTRWKVTSRYEPMSQAEAESLYEAIAQNPNGVLTWVRNFW